ncbi:hypothetical protein Kpol_1025p6 [Vanderwaltozyma polyspora DSM 70294]|uniref:SPX domain-containing protein n=1 Tax=Vanderwaltozyma polyspora (strain ATCC 22028 / DSM 70294 / BCRC 21397 / CBS 2163 / NBRC 10782 / NRRL Y-8283 / UCD 57-17) TaxID=436907 RepID=A7TKT2_VANPO|nr:uncharacterized protein Kpol_1025p6 [Vanderwaltozyma polyspora DSM 70294]EDO17087.1 hypothetical protein Kpol_1025p6 [Vanderwaltozyma polyspora DSM 70294]
MKFAQSILDKSVPEWKFNNIDYEKLKKLIKEATTASDNDTKNLNKLASSFKEQLENVNLFTSMKVKELSTRLVSIESSILHFKEMKSVSKNVQKNQLRLIMSHLDDCNSEWQKLSRFVILQRIALKKLFKKFTKHYHGGQEEAKDYIEKIKDSPEYKDGYEGISFVNIDLEPFLLEVSLIAAVIHELNTNLKQNSTNNDRENIIDDSKTVNSTLEFDTISLGNSSTVQSFLLSIENIEEFKFMLLKSGYHLVDDEVSFSREVLENSDITSNRTTTSARSITDLRTIIKDQHMKHQAEASQKSCTSTTALCTQSRLVYYLIDSNPSSPLFLENESMNLYPNILLTEKNNFDSKHNVLLCHVGGIRDHFTTNKLSYSYLQDIISKETQEEVNAETNKRNSNPVEKLAVQWISSHNLKILDTSISFNRSRFVKYSDTETYYITLDDEFTFNGKSISHAYVKINKSNSMNSKISVSKTNKKKRSTEFEKLCELIIENKCQCYPLSEVNTEWKIFYQLKDSHDLQADLYSLALQDKYEIEENIRLTTEEFFKIGTQLVLEMCSTDFQAEQQNVDSINPLTVKENGDNVENDVGRVRYWNEFDDGEDFADNGFYVNNSLESQSFLSENAYPKDNGFIKFSKPFINSVYDFCQKFRSTIGLQVGDEYPPLLSFSNGRTKYTSRGSIPSGISSSISNDHFDELLEYERQNIEDSDAIYEYKHDQVVTFMYLTILSVSSVTSGISLGIILALFKGGSSDSNLEVASILTIIIISSLLVSLILNCTSLMLLFSRFTLAPLWHYIISFLLFLLVTCTVCYGIIEIFL